MLGRSFSWVSRRRQRCADAEEVSPAVGAPAAALPADRVAPRGRLAEVPEPAVGPAHRAAPRAAVGPAHRAAPRTAVGPAHRAALRPRRAPRVARRATRRSGRRIAERIAQAPPT